MGAPGFVAVVPIDEIEDGETASFDVSGRRVIIARLGDVTYAFDESCTHKRCSLLDGEVEDGVVACPCHGTEFDLATGDVLVGPATVPLPVHETRLVQGLVHVRLSAMPPLEGLL